MPLVRKMTAEEIANLERGEIASRQAITALYDDLLSGVTIGDEIELELDPDEQRTTVINRLRAAAARCTPPFQIELKRSSDPLLVHFIVQGTGTSAAAQPAAPAQPAAVALEVIDQSDLVEPQPLFLSQPQRAFQREGRRPYSSRYGTQSANGARPARGTRGNGARPGSARYGTTTGRSRSDGSASQRERRRVR
jgi:hypothetical protein